MPDCVAAWWLLDFAGKQGQCFGLMVEKANVPAPGQVVEASNGKPLLLPVEFHLFWVNRSAFKQKVCSEMLPMKQGPASQPGMPSLGHVEVLPRYGDRRAWRGTQHPNSHTFTGLSVGWSAGCCCLLVLCLNSRLFANQA